MEFMYIFLAFAVAIVLSNILYHFFPFLSLPLIQIGLGFLIGLLPLDISFQMNPEFFLLIFIAPLLFNDGKNSDLKSLWKFRKEIFFLAIVLVFVTVVILGYAIEWLMPMLPLAASFALAAALSPTDAVTVTSLSRRVKFSKKAMHLLEGETLINDASGVTAFQIAGLSLVTGAFSLLNATTTFFFIAIGGVLIGMVMSFIKNKVADAMRRFGMKDTILHIFLEILLPFLAYIVAEAIGVSGILAAVVAGMLQSVQRKRTDLYVAKLNIVTNNIWEAIVFFLNSMVFLFLGNQLPDITRLVWDTEGLLTHGKLIGVIVLITLIIFVLRFLFILAMKLLQGRKWRLKTKKMVLNMKEVLILTVAGVKGSVTLATMMSLPFYILGDRVFEARDLLIFISGGVILLTLIVAVVALPLLGSKDPVVSKKNNLIILEEVVNRLRNRLGTEDRYEAMPVFLEYQKRITDLKSDTQSLKKERKERKRLKELTFKWEWENLERLLTSGEVDRESVLRYKRILTVREAFSLKKIWEEIKIYGNAFKNSLKKIFKKKKSIDNEKTEKVVRDLVTIHISNEEYVIKNLKEILTEENEKEMGPLIVLHENVLKQIREEPIPKGKKPLKKNREMSIRLEGYQIERDLIQHFYENGKVSIEEANNMRQDVNLLETYALNSNNEKMSDLVLRKIRQLK